MHGLLTIVLLGTGPASASGNADEAEAAFLLGARAYAANDYDEALAQFLASHRMAANASVAFNIARCYARKNDYAAAYRWFTVASDGLTDPGVRALVDAEIRQIEPQVVVFDFQTDPPGVTVYGDRLDLGAIGETPFKLALPPSREPRTFIFHKDGWRDETIDDVSGARGTTVEVKAQLQQIVGTAQIRAAEGTTVRQGAPEGPLVCDAPCDAKLAPGNWVLYFQRPGFRDAVRQVEIVADQIAPVVVDLAPNTGAVVVDASERGSLVEVDGKAVGFTPTVVQNVPVGTRSVRVSRPGYEAVVNEVEVATDQQVALDRVELLPLTEVTAVSRRVERAELAPSSLTVLSQDELKAFQYPTIYEALRGVRGVALTYDSIYGSAAVRGLGQANDFGNRLLLLQDGAILNDNILYQSFISYDGRVDLGGIERIEVVRGPGSVLYGQGAVSGLVNLVTASADAPQGTSVSIGTFDNHVLRARVESQYLFDDARKYGFRAAISGAGSQGRVETLDPRGPANPPVTVQGFDRFVGGTTTGRVWLGAASVQWYHGNRTVDIPTGVYATVLGNPQGDNEWVDTRTMVEAKLEPDLGDTVTLSARAYFNRYQYDGILPYGPYTSVERYIGVSTGGEARAGIALGDPVLLTVGGEFVASPVTTLTGEDQYRNGDVESYLDASQPYQLAAGYALVDVTPVEALRITAGGRLDYWSTFGLAASPRVAIVASPDDGEVIKLMAGRAFRAPSIYELYYAIPGVQVPPSEVGTDLQAETVWSGELEYSHAFDEAWTGLLAGHVSLANQLIETVPAPGGGITYANSDLDIRILGVDAELRRSFLGGWMASAFYSWLDSRYEDGELVPNVPQSNAGVKLVVPVSAPQLRIAFRANLEAPRRIELGRDDTTGWAVVADLVASGTAPERNLEYAVGLYNLFDQGYAQPLTDTFPLRTMPQQGRSLMATLGMRF